MPMKQEAYGKINLGLKVTEKRADGFHTVDMIMQSISLCDTISLETAERFGMRTDDPSLPCDERNLMVKVALAFQRKTGCSLKVQLECQKRIFQAAGLAGGSTDAAAVLRLLNKYYGSPLSLEELETVGAEVGSDVPFCIRGGTQRARGRGELMTVLPAAPELQLVLLKPRELAVSTAWVYQEIDKVKHRQPQNIDGLEAALRAGDRKALLEQLGNDLEAVTLRKYPLLQEMSQALKDQGAEKVLMSGSGPTLFGIFPSGAAAQTAAQALRRQYPDAELLAARTVQEVN